jgi:hypothetical protein
MSRTNFDANTFSRGAGMAAFGGVSAVAGAIVAARGRMQAQADDAATAEALASWKRLVDRLTHENTDLRAALAERDEVSMILEAELATCRQRLADNGLA